MAENDDSLATFGDQILAIVSGTTQAPIILSGTSAGAAIIQFMTGNNTALIRKILLMAPTPDMTETNNAHFLGAFPGNMTLIGGREDICGVTKKMSWLHGLRCKKHGTTRSREVPGGDHDFSTPESARVWREEFHYFLTGKRVTA